MRFFCVAFGLFLLQSSEAAGPASIVLSGFIPSQVSARVERGPASQGWDMSQGSTVELARIEESNNSVEATVSVVIESKNQGQMRSPAGALVPYTLLYNDGPVDFTHGPFVKSLGLAVRRVHVLKLRASATVSTVGIGTSLTDTITFSIAAN